MPGAVLIKVERQGFEAATAAQKREARRHSYRGVGQRHHREYKMLKFRSLATRRYRLKPRRGNPGSGRRFAGSYAQAKVLRQRLFSFSNEPLPIGENKPFVWSGRTRSSAAASRRVRSTATSRGGKVTVFINARQLNRAGTKGRINLLEEFVRVTTQEEKEQESFGIKSYERRVSRLTAKTTTTIK